MLLLATALLACSPAVPPAPAEPAVAEHVTATMDPAPLAAAPAPLPVPEASEGEPAEVSASAAGPSIGGEPILPKPVVLGAIATADVEAGVSLRRAAIDACYTSRLAVKPRLTGKILVKFHIQRNGELTDAVIASTSLRDPAAESCVLAAITPARFSALKDGDIAIVRYPFVFGG